MHTGPRAVERVDAVGGILGFFAGCNECLRTPCVCLCMRAHVGVCGHANERVLGLLFCSHACVHLVMRMRDGTDWARASVHVYAPVFNYWRGRLPACSSTSSATCAIARLRVPMPARTCTCTLARRVQVNSSNRRQLTPTPYIPLMQLGPGAWKRQRRTYANGP